MSGPPAHPVHGLRGAGRPAACPNMRAVVKNDAPAWRRSSRDGTLTLATSLNWMDFIFAPYWPWWIGGTAMGTIIVGYWWALGRRFGASGVVTGLVRAVEDPDAERASSALVSKSPQELEAALLAATLDAAGRVDPSLDAGPPGTGESGAELGAVAQPQPQVLPSRPIGLRPRSAPVHVPAGANALFMAMLAVGGFLAAWTQGSWALDRALGQSYEDLFGAGVGAVAVALVGGVLVGFGTRMGSGCTSGHGLSGCARFQPASLVATACFFGIAVVLSFLLRAVLG